MSCSTPSSTRACADHYKRDIKWLFALWRDLGKRWSPRSAKASPAPPSAGAARGRFPQAHGFAIAGVVLALAHRLSLLDHFPEEVAHLDIRQRQLAELLGLLTQTIFRNHAVAPEQLATRCAAAVTGGCRDA